MSPNTVSIIISVAFFVFVGLGFLFGFLKGAMKSMVDVVTALACVLLAFPITKIIISVLLKPATIKLVGNWLISILPSSGDEYIMMAQELMANEATKETATDVVRLAGSLPILAVAPIIYLIVFAVLCVYLYIVALFIKIVACQKTKGVPLKFLGGAFGAIACGIIFAMFLIPAWGYTNLATDAIEHYEELENVDAEASENDVVNTVKDYTSTIKGNVVPVVTQALGGKAIFNSITTTKIDGIKINLQKEAFAIIEFYHSANELSSTDLQYYDQKQIDAIDDINETLENSEFLPLLLAKASTLVAGEYSQGHSFMGIEKPNLGERFNPTFDRVLIVLKDTSPDDVRGDVRTLSNIAQGAITTKLFANAGEGVNAWDILENSDFLSIVFVELYRNPRTNNTVPYLMDAVTNYVHERYNDINDKDTSPEPFNYENYTEKMLKDEAVNISNMTKEIHLFSDSTDFSEDAKMRDVISNANLAALGRGLQLMRDGELTNRMFKILFHALLYSEAVDEMGMVDDVFIEKATKPNANLEQLFTTRQNVLKLAIAIQEKKSSEERKKHMHSVVEDILNKDESASTVISRDNLLSLGMTNSEADSIEAIVNSMVDGADKCQFENDEDKQIEIHKTEVIIDAVSNTVLSETNDSMFLTDENGTSTTDMTAREFVDSVLDSRLSSEMVNSAVVDENGEKIEDPYKIHGSLTDSDKEEMTNAINDSYAKEDLTDEERKALDSLSEIFGVTVK